MTNNDQPDYSDSIIPDGALEGSYCLGSVILVSRESINEGVRNPKLPEWFPAIVCTPGTGAGNGYRWYDPFVWYRALIDLSNGGSHWPCSERNKCYVGKLWNPKFSPLEYWAIPASEADLSNLPSVDASYA